MLPGEVEVHYATYDAFDEDVAFARLGPELDAQEHARLARMRRPEPWRHFLVSHALRHRVGGEITNLTHTDGAVAVAVAATGQVGVDVEDLTRTIDPRDGFERMFTEAEWTWIHKAHTTERFLRLWTLKEAWSKAIGLGLSADLRTAMTDGRWAFEQWFVEQRYVIAVVATGSEATKFRLIYNDLASAVR
jgi:phosphopantetheine--protein transferase-like protein